MGAVHIPIIDEDKLDDIITALQALSAPSGTDVAISPTGMHIVTEDDVQGAISELDSKAYEINSSLTQLGTFYSYSWTANSSSSFGAQLTQPMTLPKGVYILVGVAPILSVADFTVALSANKSINAPFLYNSIRSRTPIIFTFQVTEDNTDVWISSGGSTSVTYSNISEGSGRIVRVR